MSKLNPQKASAYVGPGVLKQGGKTTPVPNGPLIKKKGPYAGSTLKSGGKVKKGQEGVKIGNTTYTITNSTKDTIKGNPKYPGTRTPRTSMSNSKTDQGISNVKRLLKSKAQNGTSQYSDPKPLFDKIKKTKDSINNATIKLKEDKFKSKMKYLNSKLKNEQSIMNTKKAKAGGMIKRADGSYSKRGLWDNIRANKGSGKKPTKQMLQQEKKIKAKTKK